MTLDKTIFELSSQKYDHDTSILTGLQIVEMRFVKKCENRSPDICDCCRIVGTRACSDAAAALFTASVICV